MKVMSKILFGLGLFMSLLSMAFIIDNGKAQWFWEGNPTYSWSVGISGLLMFLASFLVRGNRKTIEESDKG